jgi:hypothetical protein
MSINVAKANLMDALKQLRIRWIAVSSGWDDVARRQFEKDFLDPLEAKIRNAVKGLDHVSELQDRVRRECGDEGDGRSL